MATNLQRPSGYDRRSALAQNDGAINKVPRQLIHHSATLSGQLVQLQYNRLVESVVPFRLAAYRLNVVCATVRNMSVIQSLLFVDYDLSRS